MNGEIKSLLDLSKLTASLALDKLNEIDRQQGSKSYNFSSDVPREMKAAADIIIENLILEKLTPTGIDILSEEAGLLKGSDKSLLKFIVDPIDGTVNFVRGIAKCSISIALFDGDKAIFGVIATFPEGGIAWGGKGIGSFVEGATLSVSSIFEAKKGVLCTGFPSRFNFDAQSMSSQMNLMSFFAKIRMIGSASQSLLQVARGSVDCYVEQEIMLWDVAAGIAIVEGSGGKVKIEKGSIELSLNIFADNGTSILNKIRRYKCIQLKK